jgi:predicted membrane protein
MSAPPAFRMTSQLVFGLLVIVVGVLFTLDNLGITQAETYLRYWPIGILAIGLVKLSQAQGGRGAIAGLIFTIAGLWLLLEETGLVRLSFFDMWPVVLVILGGYMVWQGLRARDQPAAAPPAQGDPPWGDVNARVSAIFPESEPSAVPAPDNNSRVNAMAILGGVTRGNNSSAFRRADLVAIMGGCELDLRKAAINGEAVIDVFAMWGGIEIRVPEDWTVVSEITPLLGGVEDKTRPPQSATAHRVTLRGFAIMGGIEIKN